MDTVYQSERLAFQQLKSEHGPIVLALFNQPDCIRYIGDRGIRNLQDAQDYIHNGPQGSYRQHGYGMYLLLRKQDQEPVGLCGLVKRDYLDIPDLGFALLTGFEGQGYALEAAKATLEFAHKELGLAQLAAITDPQNERSSALLYKLGMQFNQQISVPGEEQKRLDYFSLEFS